MILQIIPPYELLFSQFSTTYMIDDCKSNCQVKPKDTCHSVKPSVYGFFVKIEKG